MSLVDLVSVFVVDYGYLLVCFIHVINTYYQLKYESPGHILFPVLLFPKSISPCRTMKFFIHFLSLLPHPVCSDPTLKTVLSHAHCWTTTLTFLCTFILRLWSTELSLSLKYPGSFSTL